MTDFTFIWVLNAYLPSDDKRRSVLKKEPMTVKVEVVTMENFWTTPAFDDTDKRMYAYVMLNPDYIEKNCQPLYESQDISEQITIHDGDIETLLLDDNDPKSKLIYQLLISPIQSVTGHHINKRTLHELLLTE